LQLLHEQDFGFYEGKRFYEWPKGSENNGRDVHPEANLNSEGFQDVESKQSMMARVEAFLNEHLVPLLPFVAEDETVAVVAHGIILSYLWRGILARFQPGNVSVAAGVMAGGAGMSLEYLGGWSNTGYLDLEITSKVEPHPGLTRGAVESSNLLPAASSSKKVPDPTLPDGSALMQQAQTPMPGLTTSTGTFPSPSKLPNLTLMVKGVNSQDHIKGLKKTGGGIGSLKHDEKQKTVDSFFERQKPG
jgi:hypothetical protein